jgi:hypothetical protein
MASSIASSSLPHLHALLHIVLIITLCINLTWIIILLLVMHNNANSIDHLTTLPGNPNLG